MHFTRLTTSALALAALSATAAAPKPRAKPPARVQLRVILIALDGGTVTAEGATSFECWSERGGRQQGSCDLTVAAGTIVRLKADAHKGSHFEGWEGPAGSCNGSGEAYALVLDTDTKVIARFLGGPKGYKPITV